MAQTTMYPTIIGDYKTTLTAPYQAGIDTTVSVVDTSFLPASPNTCTIKIPDQLYLVTVRYTGKTTTSLTGVTVVQGTPSAALTSTFAIGSELSKPITQDDIQAMQDNIRDLAAGGGSGGTVSFANITGQPTDNAALNTALSNKVTRNTSQSSPSALAFEMGSDANGLYYWDA